MIDKGSIPGVWIYADGREVCRNDELGRREYSLRKHRMANRQKMICCFYGFLPECPGRLGRSFTFDHERGRGNGGFKRDDRIEIDGLWLNGAAHLLCNGIAGSRRFDYNLTLQARSNYEAGNSERA